MIPWILFGMAIMLNLILAGAIVVILKEVRALRSQVYAHWQALKAIETGFTENIEEYEEIFGKEDP